MLELYRIPLTGQKGVYSVADFGEDMGNRDDNAIFFEYDGQYQMLTYDVPVGKDRREITLYQVPEDDLVRTLCATYGKDGTLENIIATRSSQEILIYTCYENEEHARQELRRFAIRNAEAIAEQIQLCTDVVARVFIEYYCDGDNMDYHAVVGTAVQMEAIRQKYQDEDSCDSPGNYPSENIEGDNERLIVMIRCAEGHPSENFRYVVEIMSKYIREHALSALHRTEDFKYICAEYD